MGVARVGILGGAFDPPHLGHVELARAAVAELGLARLLVRVVSDPGHRGVTAPAGVRLRLARLAFASVAAAEVALDPHARTVDSLAALALPDPVFVVGADEFASFLSWKEPERVLELARLAVGSRPGVPRARLDDVRARLAHPERVSFFDVRPVDVASTEIRRRAAAGLTLDGLVPGDVAREVARLGLYRAPSPSASPG